MKELEYEYSAYKTFFFFMDLRRAYQLLRNVYRDYYVNQLS